MTSFSVLKVPVGNRTVFLTGSRFSGLGDFIKIVSLTSFFGIYFSELSSAMLAISCGRLHIYSSSLVIILNLFEFALSLSWAEEPFLFLGDVASSFSWGC